MPGETPLPQGNYGGHCWWCGVVADSREHRHKASDLRREFGRGSFPEVVRAVHGVERLERIRGPKSAVVKFPANMCMQCNNARSQPFDKAQESFNGYLRRHERRLWKTRTIDFREVFGPSWSVDASNLMRFWIKHVACRLAEHEFEVLPPLTRALDGAGAVEGLRFQLLIRRDLVQLTKFLARIDGDFSYTALGDLHGFSDGINPTTRIESSLGYRWFEVRWLYDLTTIGPTPITFGEPVFTLGHGYRVHPLIVRTRLEARHALHLDRP